jgi:hypothetical protein
MAFGDGLCPNSFRATGDNSTAYAGSFGDIRSVERDSMTGVRSCPALASTGWPISAVAAAPTTPPNARETAHTLRRDFGGSERRAVIMPAQDVMPVRGGHERLFLLTRTAPRMFMLRQDLSR